MGTAYTKILYDQSGESLGENNRSTWTQSYVNFMGRHLAVYQNNATYSIHVFNEVRNYFRSGKRVTEAVSLSER